MRKSVKPAKNSVQPVRKEIVLSFALVLVTVLFPILFLYFRNLTLIKFNEVLISTGIFLAAALVVFCVSMLFTRNLSKSALFTSVAMAVIMLFNLFEKAIDRFIPGVFYWHLVYILLTLVTCFAIYLYRWAKGEHVIIFNKIIAAVLAGLIVINFVPAVPKIVEQAQKGEVKAKEQIIQQGHESDGTNVYYFIFDEYSGIDALQRYTGYDNTPFYEALEARGFNVSPHSRNYTTSTNIEVPNLLNLALTLNEKNYSTSAQAEVFKAPALFTLFKDSGYAIHLIDDQTFIPVAFEGIDRVTIVQDKFSKTETFQLTVLKNSIVYPLFIAKEDDRLSEINVLIKAMEDSASQPNQYQLTVGYFSMPHLPWVVDENGNAIDGNDRTNWKNSNVYLGQLKYITHRLLGVVDKILETDPKAIIILQSDHGYRQPIHLEKWFDIPIKDYDLEMQFQRNILNAVYYKGEAVDIEGLSGVNTLIKIFNNHFRLSLPSAEPSE